MGNFTWLGMIVPAVLLWITYKIYAARDKSIKEYKDSRYSHRANLTKAPLEDAYVAWTEKKLD